MRDLTSLLTLPTSLIALLALIPPTRTQPWPYNLPPYEKYYPEHEQHVERDLEIAQKLSVAPPVGVHKMSDDEGEKFYMEYWQFSGPSQGDLPILEIRNVDTNTIRSRASSVFTRNASMVAPLLSPMIPHSDGQQFSGFLSRMVGRNLFERDFQCPSGTTSCTPIGQPDSCCQTGETCITVENTGSGSVGCCASGETCGNEVIGCDTAEGYTSCPGTSNGGCCIPGYTCQGVGCVYAGTATTVTTLPAVIVTTGESYASSSSLLTTTTAVIVSAASVPASVQTVTTTLIITPSSSADATTVTQVTVITATTATTSSSTPSTSTTTLTEAALTCSPGYQSCPSTLGGGCCPTSRACGSASCPALSTTTTTASAVAPIRPTSDASTITTTTTTAAASATASASVCPTGFYVCSAYYAGGCCRVGRDCASTSCPASASTSVIAASGLTVVAPSGASSASADTSGAAGALTVVAGTTAESSTSSTSSGGSCASGWFSCGVGAGGGCCPSGYACGSSCSATGGTAGASGGSVGKEAPSAGSGVRGRGTGWVGALVLGVVSRIGTVVF